MSKTERAVAYDGGQLFRVEHQPIDGRRMPYEFIRRVGATTVLPITEVAGEPHIVSIYNTRAYYGGRLGLPGGNADGRFDNPEHPTATGLREVHEETGYGYRPDTLPNVDTFVMRPVSTTILYDRSFSVVRGLEYIGGEDNNPREVVEPRLVSVEEYLDPLFAMRRGELYPEINLAIAKAGLEVGRDQTTDWVINGEQSSYAQEVVASFDPWMTHV